MQELEASTRTAADAVAALGCPVGAIANSLVFLADDQPVLVLTSGAHRVDTAHLAAQMRRRLADLGAEERAEVEHASRLLRRARAARQLPVIAATPTAAG